MIRCPGLAKRRVRSLTPEDCRRSIEQAFDTPRQRAKARLILSALFTTAARRGWCGDNPVKQVEAPRLVEKRIEILAEEEIATLLKTAAEYRGGICLPAVALMLYAGIRPHEVMRLQRQHIDLETNTICILPQHSKTGGARLVTIHPPLAEILKACYGGAEGLTGEAAEIPICPPNWLRHRRRLHRLAGWNTPTHPWQPDVLRHTFASHHLHTYRDYTALQYEMGHRSSTLLRTRYINLRPFSSTGKKHAPSSAPSAGTDGTIVNLLTGTAARRAELCHCPQSGQFHSRRTP